MSTEDFNEILKESENYDPVEEVFSGLDEENKFSKEKLEQIKLLKKTKDKILKLAHDFSVTFINTYREKIKIIEFHTKGNFRKNDFNLPDDKYSKSYFGSLTRSQQSGRVFGFRK